MSEVVLRLKSDFYRIHPVLSAGLFVSMVLVTVALTVEYRFFKSQVQELNELKSDYNSCISALRRQVADNQTSVIISTSDCHMKPKAEERRFLVLNRKSKYLKREALKFAKTHNLETPIGRLYEKSRGNNNVAKKEKRSSKYTKIKTKSRIKRKRIRKITCLRSRVKRLDQKLLDLKQKIDLIWPVARGKFRISSPFGPRKNPNGTYGFHTGIDLAATHGTLLKAAAAGTVVQAGYYKGYGNMVLIRHAHNVKTRYAHLSKIDVSVAQKLQKGQCIGKVGNTGHVRRRKGGDGSHLHFEIYISGKRLDPRPFLP